MTKHIVLTVMALGLSSRAMAFSSGDKIICDDPQLKQTYTLKIVDLGDQSAYVRVEGKNPGFYDSSHAGFSEYDGGAQFLMFSKDYKWSMSLDIPEFGNEGGKVTANYSDSTGGEHSVTCAKSTKLSSK